MRKSAVPSTYDAETDVIVIGYGFAGAVTAITAHDAGAEVTVLEKMAQPGGNSRVSGGNCVIPRDSDEAVESFTDYLTELCFGTTPRDVVEAIVREARTLVKWCADLGGDLHIPEQLIVAGTYPRTVKGPGFPKVPGGQGTFDKYCLRGDADVPPSLRLWNLLSANVAERAIDVRLRTAAQELITDDAGAVVGVAAEVDGRRVTLRARRAVVMTCGGFENDPGLKQDHVPAKPLKFAGNPGNTGDGIRMAQGVGADLWHMSPTSTIIGFQAPEFEAAFGIFFPSDGFVYTDRHGRRYVNETGVELHEFTRVFAHFDTEEVEFPRIPSWGIFNEETRLAGPLTWNASGYNRDLYRWSPDNSAEIERGWIVRADSVEELAERLGVAVDELEATLGRYNAACASGVDTEFGRSAQTLKPIEAPYYAVPLHPTVLNTQGGARRDRNARVVDPYGEPIPRLYSAGEFGSAWGHLYQGASNITECLVTGRIAGAGAAAQEGN
ncbi:FAD-dependent oxidoreductase [Kitasatospora sp. NPDC058162]|uniref:FAD-dependent oxidoreductase n=1 Tax=Kitasatospora sp. NPDC058162 TaxID=3346362 RepID=UPI0036D8D933